MNKDMGDTLMSGLKHVLFRTKITALDRFSQQLLQFPQSKKRLGWIYEMRAGHTRLIPETKELEITYVRGERFLTFAVLIHELGHVFQDELNPTLDTMDQDLQWKEYAVAKEQDAQIRGWERLVVYAPEVLTDLNKRINEFRNQGKLENFSSFKELYDYMNDCSVIINTTLSSLPDLEDEKQYEEQEFLALKKAGVDHMFAHIETARVGDELSELEAREFIEKLVKHITKKEIVN